MRKNAPLNHDSYRDERVIAGGKVHLNLPAPILHEQVILRAEGLTTKTGSIVVHTGQYTGRSPNDKFIVNEQNVADRVNWSLANRPFDPNRFESLYRRVIAYLKDKDIFVQDRLANADSRYSVPIRVVSETAWQSLFARNLFRGEESIEKQNSAGRLTIISAPGFRAQPEIDGTNSEAFIVISLERRLVLIGGTGYAGEIKKAVFTALNYHLPLDGVLSMHCAANVGEDGGVALFFGLSGTGKTSLSADPARRLVGDDEHGWSDHGIFNLEGGCYAKVIRLSSVAEPQISAAIRMFGSVLENVKIDVSTREIDLDDATHTENTRAAYPLSYIPGALPLGVAGHPQNIFFLTADAFGVLPPVARLTTQQAIDFFLLGYTAKVAGTEKGLPPEPVATFSACFGAPFMPLRPEVYARLLREKINRHNVRCWLINTGWVGGQSGVGTRIPIGITRAIIGAALDGSLDSVPDDVDPFFGLHVPRFCPNVPAETLQPRQLWADGLAYDEQARKLAAEFDKGFGAFKDML